MPLSSLQSTILRALARHRSLGSYVAGSTWLANRGPRISNDIDIFHDREERVSIAAMEDAATLQGYGMAVDWLRRSATFHQALISKAGDTTKLEWVLDSDFRFFPTQRDPIFGYVLHPVDLAMNKIMAAAGRREPRDIVDALTIHREILPLGAVIWAAVEKAPGFTPEGLINEIRRLSNYTAADFRRVASEPPVDAAGVMQGLKAALEEAEAFVAQMPTHKAGLLFLDHGQVVQPDPARLGDYTTHAGARCGHWPSTSEIDGLMLDRYRKSFF